MILTWKQDYLFGSKLPMTLNADLRPVKIENNKFYFKYNNLVYSCEYIKNKYWDLLWNDSIWVKHFGKSKPVCGVHRFTEEYLKGMDKEVKFELDETINESKKFLNNYIDNLQ